MAQTCGTNDPTAGTLTYHFDGVAYRSPDQHSNPSKFVGDAKPSLPCLLPMREAQVAVSQGWIYTDGNFHSSIDYVNGGKSFEVRSIARGVVVFVGWHEWHGNVVIIEHQSSGKEPFRSLYFHLRNGKSNDLQQAKNTDPSSYSGSNKTKAERYEKYADLEYGGSTHWGSDSETIDVAVGDEVNVGQPIAKAGNTGIGGASAMLGADGKPTSAGSTNIHLHFMIAQRDGKKWYFVDPYGAYSDSTSCYVGNGGGSDAHWFMPMLPEFHGWSASQYQAAFDYYAQMNWAPADVSFHSNGTDLRVSGIFAPAGESFRVRYGMTTEQYDEYWEAYRKKGLRPHKQCFYTHGGKLRIAAIWRPAGGEKWYSFSRLTAEEFDAKLEELAKKGFRLTDFSVYLTAWGHRFAGIWVKHAKSHYCYYGITGANWQAKWDEMHDKGYSLTHFVAYASGATTRFGGIWTKGIWNSYIHRAGLNAKQYQAEYDANLDKGYRLIEVVGYNNSKSYSGLWVKGVKGFPQLH